MDHFLKRTWAQIDLDAIKHNYLQIRNNISDKSMLLCVIKADAYGHGAVALAKEYERLGADWFAVSNLEEAFQLRNNGIKKPILILGYTPANMAYELSKLNISQAVFSEEYANDLSNYAAKNNVKVKIHLKIDTGMSRIGFVFKNERENLETIKELRRVCNLENLITEGIFTHFAVADEAGKSIETTNGQFSAFSDICKILKDSGINIKIRHCSNSGGILNYPQTNLDMVRAGIILYGLFPSNYVRNKLDLQPAMSLKTVISQVKTVPEGTAVSYGGTFVTQRKTKIATVPIGYADGYLRVLSSKASMLVNGKKAPVIGRICMDQAMLDITDIENINENTVVTVFGKDGDAEIKVEDIADIANTINYEILCLISKRIPRIYIKNGEKIGQLNYLCPTDNFE
ncbi:alanine racemase [Clostridium sp. CAG:557]|jgi:alanine racemase|nr:alanine racemase [Clostridium sp. CAG:557]